MTDTGPTTETAPLAEPDPTTVDRAVTPSTPGDIARRFVVGVTPVLALWAPMVIWFLAFKPGIMTADSTDVWGQVLSGRWVDWHPPIYTALQWVSYQVVGSPALATLAQSLALAWAMSRLLRLGVRLGLPPVPVWILGVIVAFTPPVGAFAVHLWKDVPYTVGFLLVLELFLRAGLGRLRLLDDPPWTAYASGGAGVAALVLLRPNGIAVALATGVALVVIARRRVVAGAVWAGVILGCILFESLVYPALGAQDPPPRIQVGLAPFDLGYLAVEHPDELTPEELAVIDQLAPLERWRRDFDCHWTGTPMAELAPTDRVAEVRDELRSMWRDAIVSSPVELARGHLCAAGVAWNPVPTAAERERFEYLYTGIVPNELGLATVPAVDGLDETGREVLSATMTAGWQPWWWRAPTWIYLCLLAALVISVRSRTAWAVVALAPLFAQQASVIAMAGPHARYMLPAGIAAVLALPALVRAAWTVRRDAVEDAGPSAVPTAGPA